MPVPALLIAGVPGGQSALHTHLIREAGPELLGELQFLLYVNHLRREEIHFKGGERYQINTNQASAKNVTITVKSESQTLTFEHISMTL